MELLLAFFVLVSFVGLIHRIWLGRKTSNVIESVVRSLAASVGVGEQLLSVQADVLTFRREGRLVHVETKRFVAVFTERPESERQAAVEALLRHQRTVV